MGAQGSDLVIITYISICIGIATLALAAGELVGRAAVASHYQERRTRLLLLRLALAIVGLAVGGMGLIAACMWTVAQFVA